MSCLKKYKYTRIQESDDSNSSDTAYKQNDELFFTADEQILHPLKEAISEFEAEISNLKNLSETVEEVSHGNSLGDSDLDRIKTFINEFLKRGLLCWVEKTLKSLNDQVQSKKSILKSLGLQKKTLFGTSNRSPLSAYSSSQASVSIPNMQQAGLSSINSSYNENYETQLRRLADLCFLFRFYELSYAIYCNCKKEFSNDVSSVNLASAIEMVNISGFMHMQSNFFHKQSMHNQVEEALHLYQEYCKMQHFGIRCILLNSELFKASDLYSRAGYLFLNIVPEDSDLISALFHEQAALCFSASQIPMTRKFAYNMAIAGYRYNKFGKVRIFKISYI